MTRRGILLLCWTVCVGFILADQAKDSESKNDGTKQENGSVFQRIYQKCDTNNDQFMEEKEKTCVRRIMRFLFIK